MADQHRLDSIATQAGPLGMGLVDDGGTKYIKPRRNTGLKNTGKSDLPTSKMGTDLISNSMDTDTGLSIGNPGTNLPISSGEKSARQKYDSYMRYRRAGMPFQFKE